MNGERLLMRVRSVLDEWFVLATVALLALALFGGWTAYGAYADDSEAERESVQVEAWSATGGFDHRATVTEENEVWDVGTELEDRSVYFARASPELEGEFRYWYEAPTGDVAIDVELVRVIRSVDDGEDGDVYWAVKEPIDSTSADGVGPDEEQTATFSVDVPTVENETSQIEESVGGSPGATEIAIVARVAMVGTIDGEEVDRTEEYELFVDPSESTYAVEGGEFEERSEERTELVQTASSGGLFGPIGGALLFFASIAGLGAMAIAKVNGRLAPSEEELAKIAEAYEREEFDEWISKGRIPDRVRERDRIRVESLEDLVDVAIDCDRRVIEDDDDYYVVDGEMLYAYESVSGEAAIDNDDSVAVQDGEGAIAEPAE